MTDDPFPRERVAATLRRLPAYARLGWRLAREPLLSRARRAAVVAAAGYLASPIDLVPGVIPVVGQLDDLAVALAAIRLALRGLDPARRRAHLEAVGLRDEDLSEDLRTVGATTSWLARAAGRTGVRAARGTGRAAARGARVAARTAGRLADSAVPVARRVGDAAAPMAGALRRRLPRRGARPAS